MTFHYGFPFRILVNQTLSELEPENLSNNNQDTSEEYLRNQA